MVTSQSNGGLMPNALQAKEGYIWQKPPKAFRSQAPTERVPCADEEEFFARLGIEEIPHPRERSKETAIRMARMLKTERAAERALATR